MNPVQVERHLRDFLEEDLGFGDVSGSFWGQNQVSGFLIAKQAGIVCGQMLPQQVFDLLGAEQQAAYHPLVAEGTLVGAGTKLGQVSGGAATILAGERVILNLLQRMSGIATATQAAVQALNDPLIRIADTRKTLPGLRIFDKYAVTVGGGVNHRMGLDHGLMLKDNHLAAAGGVAAAVRQAKTQAGPLLRVEVEVETIAELRAAIAAAADVIMFDNQTPSTARQWAQLVPATILTEVSGGVTLADLPDYRGCGVDFISLGYLTNDVRPVDISCVFSEAVKA
ncbi:carboxylating nicotinate-nucleotide diphosphorylase [Lapidilactobacillus luobeiensis]|uniref:carboxylating nicotinate-nucleotide diphosphorylase n=1 Tax=Lapidilactobacillus luobeiensis TaxID=2950371 RepID=UPI0021C2AF7A|nr:carboxylating nicotinate-nucleotide diphosphorylase [Lapidilactobacillus luobeiensis]